MKKLYIAVAVAALVASGSAFAVQPSDTPSNWQGPGLYQGPGASGVTYYAAPSAPGFNSQQYFVGAVGGVNNGGGAGGSVGNITNTNTNTNTPTANANSVNTNVNAPVAKAEQGQGQLQGQGQKQSSSTSTATSTSTSTTTSTTQSQTATNAGNVQNTTFEDIRQAPGLAVGYAPASAPCRIAGGAGVSFPGGAISVGGSIEDEECQWRENARSFAAIGDRDTAVEALCQIERNKVLKRCAPYVKAKEAAKAESGKEEYAAPAIPQFGG